MARPATDKGMDLMASEETNTTCNIVCFLFGLAMAALAWYLLKDTVDYLMLTIISVFVLICSGWMAYEAFCGGSTSAVSTSAQSSQPQNTSLLAVPEMKPKAVAKPTVAAVAPKASAAVAKKSAPAKKKAPAKKASTKKAAAKKEGPKLFTSAPAKVDDLKLISGVGPKLEGVLHKLGVYQYAQIASWKKADIEYVDERLKFKGRIERDDWIKQAKALDKGGEKEYIRVFGKKPR